MTPMRKVEEVLRNCFHAVYPANADKLDAVLFLKIT